MKYLFPAVFLISSCAHRVQELSAIQFPYAEELVQKVQKNPSRSIASLAEDELVERSPRRIYFSALYYQYRTMGEYLSQNKDLSFCPQFHHDKLEADELTLPRLIISQTTQIDENGRVYFPELIFGKHFSLSDYHQLLARELELLCEEGVSDNFYKFDNLVTYYAPKSSFHQDSKAMASVLKIPVFANFYLLRMLQPAGTHFTSVIDRRFIQLTRTDWFENYVAEASQMRGKFLKDKMVKR